MSEEPEPEPEDLAELQQGLHDTLAAAHLISVTSPTEQAEFLRGAIDIARSMARLDLTLAMVLKRIPTRDMALMAADQLEQRANHLLSLEPWKPIEEDEE